MTEQTTHNLASRKQAPRYHHGKTPAAWAGTLTATGGFVVGGIGMLLGPNWVVFWIGAALLVLACILALVLQKLGYGAS